mmetsp:Transcript_91812/g.176704  ORF Transcript_91812/g.176704 Transcript_91812/m.176704 type:complete len:218 (-) Transcript_91812:69-722(-)
MSARGSPRGPRSVSPLTRTVGLRERQWAEYEKLCGELRLRPNTGVATAIQPRPSTAVCECGTPFLADNSLCPRCREPRQEQCPKELPPKSHEYDFSRLYLGDRHVRALAGALAVDRNIIAVMLPCCGMMDAGMVSLCEQLKRSEFLQFVDISENRFSYGGAEAAKRMVEGATSLVLLNAHDTCLQEQFCLRRGLPSKYMAISRSIRTTLHERALATK